MLKRCHNLHKFANEESRIKEFVMINLLGVVRGLWHRRLSDCI